jgi:hypothetical protein
LEVIRCTVILPAIPHTIKAPERPPHQLETRGLTGHSILVELELGGRNRPMLGSWSD